MAYLIDSTRIRALLFDVDGTLAETEAQGHLPAFNQAFSELGIPWHWTFDDYRALLRVTGGFERLQAYALQQGMTSWLSPEGLSKLKHAHRLKNALYAERLTRGLILPRLGLDVLMQQMRRAEISWGVVTTTSRDNWEALWQNCLAQALPEPPVFAICGEDVKEKKPHPEAYLLALKKLGIAPAACLAVEDSPNGLMAALAAKLDCLIVRSVFFQDAEFPGALVTTDEHLGLQIADAPGEYPEATGLQ